MPTLAQHIDSALADSPHPIAPFIREAGGAASMTHAIRYKSGGYNWCNSTLAADRSSAGSLEWSRIGVNLYDHANGLAYGTVLEFDGPSHEGGLTEEQIPQVIAGCKRVGYATALRSTGGGGVHVFILFADPISASPADQKQFSKRAAIQFCDDAGIPIEWVDVTSNVLWIATDDPQPRTFEPITIGTDRLDAKTLPPLPIIPHTRHGDIPNECSEAAQQLICDIQETGFYAEWQADIGAIHAHKAALPIVQHKYPGRFSTVSPGTDPGSPNCWIRADDDEAGWWVYSWQERETGWEQSVNGYTRARFGVPSTFRDANTGTPENRSTYRYDNPDEAVDAIRALTGHVVTIPEELRDHQFSVVSKGDVYRLHAHKLRSDEPRPEGWHKGKGYWWTAARLDGIVTKLTPTAVRNQFWQTSQGKRYTGLYHVSQRIARSLSRQQAMSVIRHLLGGDDPTPIIDDVTANPVELLCEPFQSALQPGGLNIGTQLILDPAPGSCRTWLKMLARLGRSLTPALRESKWARANGITTGGRYLLLWCGFLYQSPHIRVPGIAIVGPGQCGKSTFGDALTDTMDDSGVTDAGDLLRLGSQFAGPVVCSLVARIEEMNISGKSRRDRINSWVTSPYLWAEFKGETPFRVRNNLRILMTCNDPRHIPVYDQESRFTVVEIGKLEKRDPRFLEKLQSERAAFVHLCRSIDLPKPIERLGLLPVDTDAKEQIAENNQTIPERFASERINVTGKDVDFATNADIFASYQNWCSSTRIIQVVEDSAALATELSEWYSMRGVAAHRTAVGRGRRGVTLKA